MRNTFNTPSLEERLTATRIAVTLDGKPARIQGARLDGCDGAVVMTLDGSASAEWSWTTAIRIVGQTGRFRT
tara:strand:+ start:165 stop:380 length:216 start_codon:yes stop_codon:yes gene_type:complete